ncbi:MAG: GntR family transcriptional regulator [Anaerovoracaceae bacterium]
MSNSSLRAITKETLLQKIHNSEFGKDEIITESNICELMNISRTPAREALIQLTTSGVLQRVPRKGYKIVEFDEKRKLDLYEILASLDALAARLSLAHITKEDLVRMKEEIDLAFVSIKYSNYSAYCLHQDSFHNIYINKCDNEQLIFMLKETKSHLERYTYFSVNSKELFATCHRMNEEHSEIVSFFEKKDAASLYNFLLDKHWSIRYEDML